MLNIPNRVRATVFVYSCICLCAMQYSGRVYSGSVSFDPSGAGGSISSIDAELTAAQGRHLGSASVRPATALVYSKNYLRTVHSIQYYFQY